MNLERISDALQTYTGQEDSMRQVVAILEEELGENWAQTVFQDLQSLPPALKNNLTQVFNYYAATTAWNEAQGYLIDPHLQLTPELKERLPILKHWLDFFRQPGQDVYKQLEKRVSELTEPETTSDPAQENFEETKSEAPSTQNEETKKEQNSPEGKEQKEDTRTAIQQSETSLPEVSDETQTDNDIENTDDPLEDIPEQTRGPEKIDEEEEIEAEGEQSDPIVDEEFIAELEKNPSYFEIKRLSNQLSLLEENQAWLSARCIQLNDIEIYAYPFYGFIVDLTRQILKSMETISADEGALELLDIVFEGGKQAFDDKKQAIEHDIELAEQNCESSTTALISEDVDMDEVKRTLGTIDTSDTVEYVGPAPDGFELLDDETPLDENAIKQQYEKLENIDALTGQQEKSPAENTPQTENTSQTEQKGVQRKLSFSLKKKKPTEDG